MREPSFEVVIGFKGVGKTYTTNGVTDKYIVNDPSGWKGRPALVFDVNNEYCDSNGYYGYKAIDFDVNEANEFKRSEQIRKIIAPGKYRIVPYQKNGQPMTINQLMITASTIVKYYRNGMLILEDINKYAGSNFKQDFVGMFIGMRHLGVDLIAHFQSLHAIPPKIWDNMNYLRWHKQAEKIIKYRNHVSNLELFTIAECIVDLNYQLDEHYFLWVDTMKQKLINVTPEDFRKGCIMYLQYNRHEIGSLMSHTDLEGDGKKKYSNEKEAVEAFIQAKSKAYLSVKAA